MRRIIHKSRLRGIGLNIYNNHVQVKEKKMKFCKKKKEKKRWK